MTSNTSCCAAFLARRRLPKEAQDWYIDLLKKVTETPEWIEFTDKGGLKRAFLTGPEFDHMA